MKNTFNGKISEAEQYIKRFSETGLPIFERAAEISRKRAQYQITEGHIIAALFQIAPDWVKFRISQTIAMPEQVLAEAEKEIQKTKPYMKGGFKIHPSAAVFFKKAMKFAKNDGRIQIDCLDLITALISKFEDSTMKQKESTPVLIKFFKRIKKFW